MRDCMSELEAENSYLKGQLDSIQDILSGGSYDDDIDDDGGDQD